MKRFYSILRVSATSKTGGDSDIKASEALIQLGFCPDKHGGQAHKASRPNSGEKIILCTDMHLKSAGLFWLFRLVSGKWEQVMNGRITSLGDQKEAQSTNTFVCVGGEFSRVSFVTPTEPVANNLEEIPVTASVQELGDNTITLGQEGEEVVGDERVVRIKVSDIRRFKDQPRKYFNKEKLHDMGRSFREIGQLKAISVWRLRPEEIEEDSCHYELDDGERRWLAHQLEGMEEIKAIVKTGPRKSLVDRFVLSFVANLHSESHNPYEIAKAIIFMHAEFRDVTEIHRKTGINVPTIYNYLKLRNLSPDLLEMMSPEVSEEKRLRLEHAKQLAGISDHEEQKKIYDESYSHSHKGVKAVGRVVKSLTATTGSALNFTPRKRSTRKAASRAVQNLLMAVVELDTNEEGLKNHLLFVTEGARQDIEDSLGRALIVLPKLLRITRSLSSV